MALASSPLRKSLGPAPLLRSKSLWTRSVCVGGLGIAVTVVLQGWNLGSWTRTAAPFSIALALAALWYFYLRISGLSACWSALFAGSLLGLGRSQCAAFSSASWGTWCSSLGCGIFVYAMLCVLSAYARERGLQPLATIALILAIGVVARPPVIVGCILVSLVIFIDERLRTAGLLSSLLLLFTPVGLCGVFLGIMNYFSPGGFSLAEWNLNLAESAFDIHTAELLHIGSGTLVFLLAVLGVRLSEKKAGTPDLALVVLCSFLGLVGTMRGIPGRLSVDDLRLILTCGGCALLVVAPPTRLPARVAVCVAAIVPSIVETWL